MLLKPIPLMLLQGDGDLVVNGSEEWHHNRPRRHGNFLDACLADPMLIFGQGFTRRVYRPLAF